MRFLIAILMFAASPAPCFASGTVSMQRDDLQTIILGSGFDLASNQAQDRCIAPGDDVTLGTKAKGAPSVHSVTDVFVSRDDTVRFFNTTFESSGKGTVVKGLEIGGGLTAGYTRSTNFDEQTAVIGVKVEIELQTATLQKFDLKETAKSLLAKSPEDFLRSCGTVFVSGYKAGGRLAILFTFSSLDKSEKEEITGSMKFNMDAAFASGESKGTLTSRVDHYFHEGRLKIDIFYTGGTFEFVPPAYNYDGKAYLTTLDFNGLLKSATFFEQSVIKDNYGYPYEVYIRSYDSLIDYNSVDAIDKAGVVPIIEDLNGRYDALIRIKGRLDEAIARPEEFQPFDGSRVFQWQADLTSKLNKIRTTLVACGKAPFGDEACAFLPATDTVVQGVEPPQRLKPYKLGRGPECGDPVGWEEKTVHECPAGEDQAPSIEHRVFETPWKQVGVGGPSRGLGTIPPEKYQSYSDHCTKYWASRGDAQAEAKGACEAAEHTPPDGFDTSALSFVGISYDGLRCEAKGDTIPCNAFGGPTRCNVGQLYLTCTSAWLFAPASACSERIYLDKDKPIYPLCRDALHGADNS